MPTFAGIPYETAPADKKKKKGRKSRREYY